MEKYFDGEDNSPDDEENAETPQEENTTSTINQPTHKKAANKKGKSKK